MNESIIQLFVSVCQKLDELNLPYMLTGSAAMNYYSVIRTTQDLDIVLELREEELETFLGSFPHHYYHEPSIVTEIKRKGMFNLIDFNTGYKIDFILRKNTEYAKVAFSRRWRSNDFGFPIWVIALEDLLLAKLLWIQQLYSDRQVNDIQQLLNATTIDKNYLYFWIKELNINIYNIII